jgi:Domain of unknown function (DUF4157)
MRRPVLGERVDAEPASKVRTPSRSGFDSLRISEPEVPTIVHEVLRSAGRPLDPDTRSFMEPRFGHNFANVRVHQDSKAAESARAVNARAYSFDQSIVFGAGNFAPATSEGRELLAP